MVGSMLVSSAGIEVRIVEVQYCRYALPFQLTVPTGSTFLGTVRKIIRGWCRRVGTDYQVQYVY